MIDNGFEVSSLPDYDTGELDGPEWKPIVNGSKLIKIGDITVPELRRMLLLKRRQKILNKNKYYIQQKVYITFWTKYYDSLLLCYLNVILQNIENCR